MLLLEGYLLLLGQRPVDAGVGIFSPIRGHWLLL